MSEEQSTGVCKGSAHKHVLDMRSCVAVNGQINM